MTLNRKGKKMKRIPTFRTLDGPLLVGAAAKKAWASQVARCNCGYCGKAEASIEGAYDGMPAEWLGCPNCSGSALGFPLLYRTQSQINFALNERQCYTAPTAKAAAQKAIDAVLHKAAAGKTRFEIIVDKLENGQWRAQV
jgi:hypothetical protein